jgi:ribosomal protein L39E
MTRSYQKKVKLSVHNNRTKWAPFWAVMRKFGAGKRVHPSQITKKRRHWRRTKLKMTPRIQRTSLG